MARAVIATGQAVNGPLDLDQCGPAVRAVLEKFGVTHGAYVPINLHGKLTGILSVSGRGEVIQPGVFERVRLIGSLTEMALTNAAAHQVVEEQALTDPLTKLANRRELERAFARLPDRLPFAFIAADLDDLKGVNDRFGHPAGDAVIVAVASAIASLARKGDTVARVGGDEFSVLMLDATSDGVDVYKRQGTGTETLPTVTLGPNEGIWIAYSCSSSAMPFNSIFVSGAGVPAFLGPNFQFWLHEFSTPNRCSGTLPTLSLIHI